MSSNNSILTRPEGVSPMLISKKTTGLVCPSGGSGMDIAEMRAFQRIFQRLMEAIGLS